MRAGDPTQPAARTTAPSRHPPYMLGSDHHADQVEGRTKLYSAAGRLLPGHRKDVFTGRSVQRCGHHLPRLRCRRRRAFAAGPAAEDDPALLESNRRRPARQASCGERLDCLDDGVALALMRCDAALLQGRRAVAGRAMAGGTIAPLYTSGHGHKAQSRRRRRACSSPDTRTGARTLQEQTTPQAASRMAGVMRPGTRVPSSRRCPRPGRVAHGRSWPSSTGAEGISMRGAARHLRGDQCRRPPARRAAGQRTRAASERSRRGERWLVNDAGRRIVGPARAFRIGVPSLEPQIRLW